MQLLIFKMSYHLCYFLQSIPAPKRIYIGYTVDLPRRLRQHNGEIAGGAKRTSRFRPWRLIGYISGFPDSTTALQYEWRLHHPPKRGRGLSGLRQAVIDVLSLYKVTKAAPPASQLQLHLVWVYPEHQTYIQLPHVLEYFNSSRSNSS